MQKLLLEASIKLVRQRISEGDCPVTAPLSVEVLEHMVDQLATSPDAKTDAPAAVSEREVPHER